MKKPNEIRKMAIMSDLADDLAAIKDLCYKNREAIAKRTAEIRRKEREHRFNANIPELHIPD